MNAVAPYVNLFNEEVRPPGEKPPKRSPTLPTEHARFAVGSVRYDKLDVVWMEDGKVRSEPVTAERVRQIMSTGAYQALKGILPAPGDSARSAPHVRGSATSKAAARALTPRKLSEKREAVLGYVMRVADRSEPGPTSTAYWLTDNELVQHMVEAFEWSANTPRARRIELVEDGFLEDSGERRNGSTVWRPTAKAWAWWCQGQKKEQDP